MTLANGKNIKPDFSQLFLFSVAFSNFSRSLVYLGRKMARRITSIKPERSMFKLSLGPGSLQE